MNTKTELNWSKYLRVFSEQNRNRPTRLGVFEGHPGSMSDLWLEDGLPLLSVDAVVGSSEVDIEIMLDAAPQSGAAHMSHRVHQARTLRIVLGETGESDGLEVEDATGATTILRFETPDLGSV